MNFFVHRRGPGLPAFVKHPVKLYITASVICFIILALVQCILVYNTYELVNGRFYYDKKNRLNELYSRAIINDKLFPGGQRIMDSALNGQLRQLEHLYNTDTAQFHRYSAQLLNKLFLQLRERQNVDSLLQALKAANGITDSLQHALCIHRIDVRFQDRNYINIYNDKQPYALIDPAIQQKGGVRVSGKLAVPDDSNKVLALGITSQSPYSYAVNFSLHADPVNRRQLVFDQMKLMIFLSLVTMLTVIALFYLTLRNWIKQKHLSEMKSDFINNITHEFHTPLSAIMVANRNIQNGKIITNTSAVTALTDIIQRQSDRLRLLIGQVLDISAAEKLSVHKETLSLNALVDEILTDFRVKSSGIALELCFTERTEQDAIAADAFHFTTLLLNILDNAVKYNRSPVKQVTIRTVADKEGIRLMISDNGIGMHKETVKHVFEKFYRYKEGLTNPTKGLGLGLYYVQQCVEAHQWKIKVESEPGQGSTFIINIPEKL